MHCLLIGLALCVVSSIGVQAGDIETKFQNMVNEVQTAVQGDTPDLKTLERIIAESCNMDVICPTVAKSYLLQKTKGMDFDAKKDFISKFLNDFKPIYTAYLTRVWTADSNRETFKTYKLKSCTVKNHEVKMNFENESGQNSYIYFKIDNQDLITSIRFGKDRQNMIDPISADSGSCAAGVSKGEEPKDIFSPKG